MKAHETTISYVFIVGICSVLVVVVHVSVFNIGVSRAVRVFLHAKNDECEHIRKASSLFILSLRCIYLYNTYNNLRQQREKSPLSNIY